MMKRIKIVVFVAAACSMITLAEGFAPANMFRPYDAALRLAKPRKGDRVNLTVQAEYGSRKEGRNWQANRRNVLALHDDNQSSILMLRNLVNPTAQAQAASAMLVAAGVEDDGTRGRVVMTGKHHAWDVNLSGAYLLPFKPIPGDLSIAVHVPVVHRKIDGVAFKDLTKDSLIAQDITTKAHVTNDFKNNVKAFGNLNLANWDKTGLGDVAVMLNWCNAYRQDKDYLKMVTLHAKLGVSMPTGQKKDEDQAFSMPLGHDGAWGLPVGMGMELDFVKHIKAGMDVDFLVLFDETRDRRLKTNDLQTEFLLLNKGRATKEHGLTWQFHLYLQFCRLIKGLSLGADYHFVKHDDDRLNPRNNTFSFGVVNSARSLKEWNAHNILFKAQYDFADNKSDWKVAPQLALFYKLPVAGKNIVDAHTFGGQLAVNF